MTTPRSISFRDLRIGHARHCVLGPINGSFEGGRLHVLKGANGSGKTTLLRTLIGLLRPLSGSLVREGEGRVGYVPQLSALNDVFPISVFEVVAMAVRAKARRVERAEVVGRSLARVQLQGLESRPYFALSGGERERVLVARALAAEAEFLALDEPTAGVDPAAAAALWDLILEIAASPSRVVIVITHEQRTFDPNFVRTWWITHSELRECEGAA